MAHLRELASAHRESHRPRGVWCLCTVKVTSVVWEDTPLLVPVTASVYVPVGVLVVVVTERVDDQEDEETGLFENETLESLGFPLTLRATEPSNPPVGVTVTV